MGWQVGDTIGTYYLTQEDIEFIYSEKRQRLLDKLNLLGELNDFTFKDDYVILTDIRRKGDVTLPDIALSFGPTVDMEGVYGIHTNPHLRIIRRCTLQGLNLKVLELNEGLKVIEGRALCDNRLQHLKLPESIEYIGAGALSSALKSHGVLEVKGLKFNIEAIINEGKYIINTSSREGNYGSIILPSRIREFMEALLDDFEEKERHKLIIQYV